MAYDQHLLFVEPSCKLAPSPQGSDPFPVSRFFSEHQKKKAGIYLDVSKNRGTPKCMVYNGNLIKMDGLGVPLFLETPISKGLGFVGTLFSTCVTWCLRDYYFFVHLAVQYFCLSK